MKIKLPADLQVTFFPTPGDDTRKSFPLLEHVGEMHDEKGSKIKIFMSSNGQELELVHPCNARAIVHVPEIIACVVRSTFARISLPETPPYR